jgi:hypothetical protein
MKHLALLAQIPPPLPPPLAFGKGGRRATPKGLFFLLLNKKGCPSLALRGKDRNSLAFGKVAAQERLQRKGSRF